MFLTSDTDIDNLISNTSGPTRLIEISYSSNKSWGKICRDRACPTLECLARLAPLYDHDLWIRYSDLTTDKWTSKEVEALCMVVLYT